MKGAGHVPGQKKFACQNKALVFFWQEGEHASAVFLDEFIGFYKTLSERPASLCGSQGISFAQVIVPPILAHKFFRPRDNEWGGFRNPMIYCYHFAC
jgi:hypothetical protein